MNKRRNAGRRNERRSKQAAGAMSMREHRRMKPSSKASTNHEHEAGAEPVVALCSHASMGEAKDGSKAVAAQVALTPASLPARCGRLLQQADTCILTTMHTAQSSRSHQSTPSFRHATRSCNCILCIPWILSVSSSYCYMFY